MKDFNSTTFGNLSVPKARSEPSSFPSKKELTDEAQDLGELIGLPDSGMHNGAMDAFRHAYANAYLSSLVGPYGAEEMGLGYEIATLPANTVSEGFLKALQESLMDLLNNKVGANSEQARRPESKEAIALELFFKILNGELTVIDKDGSMRNTGIDDFNTMDGDAIDTDAIPKSPVEDLLHDLPGEGGEEVA